MVNNKYKMKNTIVRIDILQFFILYLSNIYAIKIDIVLKLKMLGNSL